MVTFGATLLYFSIAFPSCSSISALNCLIVTVTGSLEDDLEFVLLAVELPPVLVLSLLETLHPARAAVEQIDATSNAAKIFFTFIVFLSLLKKIFASKVYFTLPHPLLKL